MMSDAPSVLLVDASIYLFRAFFSMPARWHDSNGLATHAVLGFTRALLDAQARLGPTHIAVAFDTSLTTCFRNRLFPAYKAQRPQPDPEIIRQMALCQASCDALGWFRCEDPELEADDLLASLHRQWRETHATGPAWFMTRDKDYGQLLLDDTTRMWDDGTHVGAREFATRYGVQPRGFPDYQALVGDAVDNVPGVRGVGPKTAAQLIARFGTLESLYENLSQVHAGATKVRRPEAVARDLEAQREQAFAMREILRLQRTREVVGALDLLLPKKVDADARARFFDQLGLARALKLPAGQGG